MALGPVLFPVRYQKRSNDSHGLLSILGAVPPSCRRRPISSANDEKSAPSGGVRFYSSHDLLYLDR